MRTLAALLVGLSASAALAQPAAVIPTEAALRPLNLTADWSAAVPVSGRTDGIAVVQVADGGQVFVQTTGGLLVALDAATGTTQWTGRYNGGRGAMYPVATNSRFVYAVHAASLYSFHRYSGAVEFVQPLPSTVSAGPTADEEGVYVSLSGSRLVAYDLPTRIKMPDPALTTRGAFGLMVNDAKSINPADQVASRYPATNRRTFEEAAAEDTLRLSLANDGSSLQTLQRTPSLSTLSSVHPPYQIFDGNGKYVIKTESVSALPTLRRPYQLRDPTSGTSQRIPSVQVVPALNRLGELTDLQPRGVLPTSRWKHGSTVRLEYTPLQSRTRIWMTTGSRIVYAVIKSDKGPQVAAPLTDVVAAQPAQADDIGFFPLSDGNLLAIDLTAGSDETYRQVWRANVGGTMNRPPLPVGDAVLMAGDNSGIVRVDRATGELLWRTDPGYDHVLAVNNEHVYVLARNGRVTVFDRNRVSDTRTKRAYPLASVDLGAFLPVTNTRTDRVFLAAAGGLLVCLRDANPAYARPVVVAPAANKPPEVKKPDPADAAATDLGASQRPAPTPATPPPPTPMPPKPTTPPTTEPKTEPEPKKESEPEKKTEPEKKSS